METPEESNHKRTRFQGLRSQFRRCWPEGSRVAGIFVAAFFIGVVYVSTWGGAPEFWQQIFGPSVMMACGEGFTNPKASEVPGLEDFLYLRAESFDCANIPDDVTVLPQDTSAMDYDEVQTYHSEPQFKGWTQWQRFHRYLLTSVALCFYLFGMTWQSLTPLYGLLYGLTNALGYGIFRLGMGRRMAVFFAVLLMTSPVHLQQLPQLRDYSKAPFFFLIILIVALLISHPMSMRLQLSLAALAGFAGGLGIGFRQDVAIAAGVFCLLIALFSPGHIKTTWWRRSLLIVVFLGAFAVLGTPIIRVLSGVNNSTHDTIIGFTHYCDQRLGVEAPAYDFGDPFLDEYVRGILMGYAHRKTGRTEVFRHYSAPYDEAGKAYFREMMVTFPADLLIRGDASVLRIVDELQISSANGAPRGITNQFLARLFQWRQWALDSIPGGGRYYVAAMILVLGAVNPRLGFAAFVAIMILAGYPALRFSERHAFHMEILTLFSLGFLVHGTWQVAVDHWHNRKTFAGRALFLQAKQLLLRGTAVALTVCLLIVGPLWIARAWQSRQVAPLLAAYAQADLELLRTEMEEEGADRIRVRLPALTDLSTKSPVLPMYTDVLVLEFAPMPDPVTIAFDYDAVHPNFRFDRTMTVPPSPAGVSENTFVYYPAYYGEDAQFQGFIIPNVAQEKLRGVYRLADLRDRGILLNAVLSPGWESGPFYQSLNR